MSQEFSYKHYNNTQAHPKLWITEYLDNVINDVDMDAEMILVNFTQGENEQIANQINQMRARMINEIKEIEKSNLKNLEENQEKIIKKFNKSSRFTFDTTDLVEALFKKYCFYVKRESLANYIGFSFGILVISDWCLTEDEKDQLE